MKPQGDKKISSISLSRNVENELKRREEKLLGKLNDDKVVTFCILTWQNFLSLLAS